jgi:thioredoxin-related protein
MYKHGQKMKRYIKFNRFFCFILLCTLFNATSAWSGIQWLKDIDEAKEQAIQQNKLILVDFWAAWCKHCIAMEKDVWSRDDIVELSHHFICVKLSDNLTRYFGLTGIPAILILDGNGKKLFQSTGYQAAPKMMQIMKTLPGEFTKTLPLIKAMKHQPENHDFIITLADNYHKISLNNPIKELAYHMFLASNAYYKEASKRKEIRGDKKVMEKIETAMAMNHLLTGDYKKARKISKKCIKKYPEGIYRPVQLYCLVGANVKLKKTEDARQYLAMLQNNYPDNQYTRMAETLPIDKNLK